MKPIYKYDKILNKFREADFTDKEIQEIRDMITGSKQPDLTLSRLPILRNQHTHAIICDNDSKHCTTLTDGGADIPYDTAVGTIIKPSDDNTNPQMCVPCAVNESELEMTISQGHLYYTVNGITEYLTFEKDKLYMISGIYTIPFNTTEYKLYTYIEISDKVTLIDLWEQAIAHKNAIISELYDTIETVKQDILSSLPKIQKLTFGQFQTIEQKDDNTFYYITDDNGTMIIAKYLGNTPFSNTQLAIYGQSSFGNTNYQ